MTPGEAVGEAAWGSRGTAVAPRSRQGVANASLEGGAGNDAELARRWVRPDGVGCGVSLRTDARRAAGTDSGTRRATETVGGAVGGPGT